MTRHKNPRRSRKKRGCAQEADPNLRTPEMVMCAPKPSKTHPLDYKDLSPKLTARIPKIKLDLDIPDCEAQIEAVEELIELNDLNLENVESDKQSSDVNFFEKGTLSSIDYDSEYAAALKTRRSRSTCSPESVELPTVSDSDAKVSGSEVLSCEPHRSECIHGIQLEQPMVFVNFLAVMFITISQFCSCWAKKIAQLFRKGHTWIRGSMTINVPRSMKYLDASVLVNEIAQPVTSLRCDNEITVSILNEKVTHISQELVQVRVQSEAAGTAMQKRIDILEGQFKSLHNALDNIQTTKPSLPSPPPPPPSSLPTTPNSSKSTRTANRSRYRCVTPLQRRRPPITVEDLLKVKLKKAPRSFKENKPNASEVPRCPMVTLDMLREVKLRSFELDHSSGSPRRASMLVTLSVSVSPRSPREKGAR